MSKTKEQLLASAEEIRTNTAPNSNTADLVGSTLKDMINKSSDDKDELQNNIDELSEGSSEAISSVRSDLSSEVARAKAAENAAAAAVTAEETRAKAAESALNTSLTGVKSDMNTLSLVNDGVKYAGLIGIDDDTNKYAANAVPTDKRKVGLIVTYLDKNGNPQTYQFTGSNISQWLTKANWQGIDNEPTAGSNNLVKSGGTKFALDEIQNKLHLLIKESEPIEVSLFQDGHYINFDGSLGYNPNVPTLCYSAPLSVTKGQIIIVQNVDHGTNYAGWAYTDAEGSYYEDANHVVDTGTYHSYLLVVTRNGYISLSFNNIFPGGCVISKLPTSSSSIITSVIDLIFNNGFSTNTLVEQLSILADFDVNPKTKVSTISNYYVHKTGQFINVTDYNANIFQVAKGEIIKLGTYGGLNQNFALFAIYSKLPTFENISTIQAYYAQPYVGNNEAIFISPIDGYVVVNNLCVEGASPKNYYSCGVISDVAYNKYIDFIESMEIGLTKPTSESLPYYNSLTGYCQSSTFAPKGTVNDQAGYTTRIIDVQNLDYIAVGGNISTMGTNYHYFALVSFSSESGFKNMETIVKVVDCIQGVNPIKVIKVPFGAKYAAVNGYFNAYAVEAYSFKDLLNLIDIDKTISVNEQFNVITEDFYYDAVNPSKVANVRGTEWSSISETSGNSITVDTETEGHVIIDTLMVQGSSDSSRCYYGANVPRGTTDRPVIIVEGTLNGTNIKKCELWCLGVDSFLLAQDHEDNLEVTIKGMVRFGTSGNNYCGVHCEPKSIDTANMTVELNLTRFFICSYIEGFSIDDYLRVYADGGDVIIKESALPKSVAYKQNVTDAVNELRNEISESGVIGTPYTIKYPSDVVMLINYGQSLSVGGSIGPSAANFHNMLTFLGGGNEWSSKVKIHDATSVANFYGTDLLLFEEQSRTVGAAVGTNAYAWMQTLIEENQVDLDNFDFQMLCSTPGESGASIAAFIKNSSIIPTDMDCNCYDRLLFSVQKGKELANRAGKTFSVPCVFWVQGETDSDTGNYNTYEAYYNALKQLAIDLNTDIRAITGQSEEVAIITYQMSSYVEQYGINKSVATFVELNLCLENQAALAAGQPSNHFYFGSSMYQFNYGTDLFHPVDRRVIGLQAGINAKRLINNEKPLPVFYPKSHWIQYDTDNSEWILSILFDVPCPPARFYYTDDGYHNVNGYQTNFGFKVLTAGGVDIIAETPTIKRGNTVVIRCNQNPAGCEVRYAINGHYGGGNLCDSQNAVFVLDNVTYTFDNFCPTFKGYIIN